MDEDGLATLDVCQNLQDTVGNPVHCDEDNCFRFAKPLIQGSQHAEPLGLSIDLAQTYVRPLTYGAASLWDIRGSPSGLSCDLA